MSYLHRVSPNKTTSSQIQATYINGKMVDANTKEPLIVGQIDKGHKSGYEERVMRKCAEKVHMSQKDYNKMMQDPRLYQFESSKNNRSHKFESNNYSLQLHNCFEVIRNYKGKNRGREVNGFEQTPFTFPSKSNISKTSSMNANKGSTINVNTHGNTSNTGLGAHYIGSHGSNSSGYNSPSGHSGSNGHGGSSGHGGSVGHGGSGGRGGH